jgi:hypothetical protein
MELSTSNIFDFLTIYTTTGPINMPYFLFRTLQMMVALVQREKNPTEFVSHHDLINILVEHALQKIRPHLEQHHPSTLFCSLKVKWLHFRKPNRKHLSFQHQRKSQLQLPMLGTNTVDTCESTVVTPPLGNNAMDTVSPTVVTLLPNKSKRSTRKRGQPAATLVKDNHERRH